MAGLRLTVVDAGPLRPDKNKLVAFASGGPVSVPTTVGIIEHPKHGLILWDTGINDIVADPDGINASRLAVCASSHASNPLRFCCCKTI